MMNEKLTQKNNILPFMNELDTSKHRENRNQWNENLQKDNDVHSYNAIVNDCNLTNDSKYDHSKTFTLFLKVILTTL